MKFLDFLFFFKIITFFVILKSIEQHGKFIKYMPIVCVCVCVCVYVLLGEHGKKKACKNVMI